MVGFAKESLELSRLLPLWSLVALGSSFYTSSLFAHIVCTNNECFWHLAQQYQNIVGTPAAPKGNRFGFAELQNTERFLLRAYRPVRNKKEPRTTVLENATLRIIMTSQRIACPNVTAISKFYFLSFYLKYVSFVGDFRF